MHKALNQEMREESGYMYVCNSGERCAIDISLKTQEDLHELDSLQRNDYTENTDK